MCKCMRLNYGKLSSESQFRHLISTHAPCHEGSPKTFLAQVLQWCRYNGRRWSTLTHLRKPHQPVSPSAYALGMKAMNAVQFGDVETLRSCLAKGVPATFTDRFGHSLLHRSCRRSNYDLFRTLLQRGANILCIDDCGRTCLHEVCWGNKSFDPRIVVALMERAPDLITGVDRLGAAPLDYLHNTDALQSVIRVIVNNATRFWFTRSRGEAVRRPTQDDKRHAYAGLRPTGILPQQHLQNQKHKVNGETKAQSTKLLPPKSQSKSLSAQADGGTKTTPI